MAPQDEGGKASGPFSSDLGDSARSSPPRRPLHVLHVRRAWELGVHVLTLISACAACE